MPLYSLLGLPWYTASPAPQKRAGLTLSVDFCVIRPQKLKFSATPDDFVISLSETFLFSLTKSSAQGSKFFSNLPIVMSRPVFPSAPGVTKLGKASPTNLLGQIQKSSVFETLRPKFYLFLFLSSPSPHTHTYSISHLSLWKRDQNFP